MVKKNNKPVHCVQNNKKKFYKPEEISSLVLCHMKKIAQRRLQNTNITEAVITVPAYFNDSQRRATKEAAITAGLKVLRIIHEPTAAALSYGHLRTHATENKILVFDLGGGTLDVSILSCDGELFVVEATAGDSHLGGQDFDDLLVEFCKEKFKNRFGLEIKEKKALSRLKINCEQAKRSLSVANVIDINLYNLSDGKDFYFQITRQQFEKECDDLFKICIDRVEECINLMGDGFTKADIAEVILVGGSSRIPKIQQMLKEFFPHKQLNSSIHPDEAVAYGAAVYAEALSGSQDSDLKSLLLVDINPLTLGIAIHGKEMSSVVKRNSHLPVRAQRTYETVADNQQTANFKVYEGERPLVKDNNLLGKFDVSNIKRAPRGVTKFIATLEIDVDGILHVSAVEDGTENKNNITIANNHRSDPKEVEEMMKTTRKYRELDENTRQIIAAKSRLEKFAYAAGRRSKNKENTSEKVKNDVTEECENTLKWLYAELVGFSYSFYLLMLLMTTCF